MANKIFLVFLALNFLFVCCGGLILSVSLITKASLRSNQTISNVATNLLLSRCPLTGVYTEVQCISQMLIYLQCAAATVNAIFIFITFLLSIPAITAPTRRFFLKLHGQAIVFCALFTMALGLAIWFETLTTRSNLSTLWGQQTPHMQSLLQQKFQCCGYMSATSPPFIQDSTCTNLLVAANLQGCVGPFSQFANKYLDIVFTTAFGIAAIDFLLLLSVACLFKDRKEKERFRFMDAKNDLAPI